VRSPGVATLGFYDCVIDFSALREPERRLPRGFGVPFVLSFRRSLGQHAFDVAMARGAAAARAARLGNLPDCLQATVFDGGLDFAGIHVQTVAQRPVR
jgi:hypothetical protein